MAGSFKRVGNDRVRVRLAHDEVAVLRGLPDQLRTVLGEGGDEPVNQRLNIELGRPAAHRVRAVDIDGVAGGQGVGEGLGGHGDLH